VTDSHVQELTALERSVLDALLAGPGRKLERLRQQAKTCKVREREFTGVGFYTDFIPESSLRVDEIAQTDVRLDDVVVEIEGLQHGAGFLLLIKDGFLNMLEGFTYDEEWPDAVKTFTVQYAAPQRDLPPELTANA
jgi:hypothetical protein